MSVDQTDVVDAIGIDDTTGQIVLTISDHLEWNNEHLLILQEKINTYLSFVESGELIDSYPNLKEREVLIDVVCKYSPNENAEGFLSQVNSIAEGAGIKFNYRIFGGNS